MCKRRPGNMKPTTRGCHQSRLVNPISHVDNVPVLAMLQFLFIMFSSVVMNCTFFSP